MERITIDISKEELDFIREALAAKYRNLISYLDTCEEASSTPATTDSVLHEAHKQLNMQIANLLEKSKKQSEWTITTTDEGNMVAAFKKHGRPRKNPNAPYGFKKDGTPAKRRGRPAKAKS